MDEIKIGGLKPLPKDDRDIRFGSIYSLPKLSTIPNEFEVAKPLKMKDQSLSSFCAAFASTAVSEDQEAVELSPEWQFQKALSLDGRTTEGDGSDLRTMANTFIRFGSLEQKDAPFTIAKNGTAYCANPNNWPNLDDKAQAHKKQSYAFITPDQYDMFDSLRATMWKSKQLGINQSIFTGCTWNQEWTFAKGGIIKAQGTPQRGHAFKIFGTKMIDNEMYLKAQLSNGTYIGDNGIFYFSRSIINADLQYGALTFTDLPVEKAQYYYINGVKVDSNWLIQWLQQVVKILTNIKDIYAKNP